MKIAYYCQHVLGVGHFFRSHEICRTCATDHEVTMIVGGPDVSVRDSRLFYLQLPGLRMDAGFQALVPCDPDGDLEETKRRRRERLLDFVAQYAPDRLIIELYPFGRKAFRFELDPLLEHVVNHNSGCRIYCSLRDILVEKTDGREKFEQRAVDVLNTSFDGILVHGDRDLVALDQTFGKTGQIRVPIHYTGYVTPRPAPGARESIRRSLGLGAGRTLVVASIGSGSVGVELLEAVLGSYALLADRENCFLQLFTGPYLDDSLYKRLRRSAGSAIRIERFSDRFVDWLAAADLSVSMAGYNTCMNTLAAEVPALLYPFGQNREQRLRLEKLAGIAAITLLDKRDLSPPRLARLITGALGTDRIKSPVDLDGAQNTKQLIERQG